MKVCSKCKIQKPFGEFHKCAKSKIGIKSACKECRNIQNKKFACKQRELFKDKINKRQKKWRKNKIKENPNYYKEQYYKYHESCLQRVRKYYKNNHETCIDRMRLWRKNNHNIMIASMNKWRKNNPEKLKQSHKEWMQNNKDHVRNYNQMRRALKRQATIQNFSTKQLDERMSVFGYKCAYCGGKFEHIDHVKPLSKGGPHCLSNLRPSCSFCNLSKHNKNLKVWIKYKENK